MTDTVQIPGANIEVPLLAGWTADTALPSANTGTEGTTVRLVRTQAVTGSPRIDIVVEPKRNPPTTLANFQSRNLRDLNKLERAGSIRIESVVQHATKLDGQPAYRVQHEYWFTSSKIAIMQISVFVIANGHGVVLTAVGRTELLTPLVKEIEAVFAGLEITVEPSQENVVAPSLQPIDLGKLGDTQDLSPP